MAMSVSGGTETISTKLYSREAGGYVLARRYRKSDNDSPFVGICGENWVWCKCDGEGCDSWGQRCDYCNGSGKLVLVKKLDSPNLKTHEHELHAKLMELTNDD